MQKFILATDSSCDFLLEDCEKMGIYPAKLTYTIGEENFKDSMILEEQMEFYNKMRAGAVPRTSQVNAAEFLDFWRPFLEQNLPILHLVLSSGLSGTYNSAVQAKEMALEEFPNAVIYLVDSLGASSMVGILLYKAVQMRDSGADIETVANWLEENKLNVHAVYTTNDLQYLHRGGRLSKGSMIIANALGIRPILKVDAEGKLYSAETIRGQGNIKKRLAEIVSEYSVDAENQPFFISHSDAEDYAKECEAVITAGTKFKETHYCHIGATIGAHTGPGLVAFFFFGNKRK